MALQSLTQSDFIEAVVSEMKLSKRIRRSDIEVAWYGKSQRFPIHFHGGDYLEKVFKKISSIVELREHTTLGSSEDLNASGSMSAQAAAMASNATPTSLKNSHDSPSYKQLTRMHAKSSISVNGQRNQNILTTQQAIQMGANEMIVAEITLREQALSDGPN